MTDDQLETLAGKAGMYTDLFRMGAASMVYSPGCHGVNLTELKRFVELLLADRAAGRALEAVPEKEWHRNCITLTALQIRHALDFAAPGFDVDEEQRETQVSIAWAPAGATHTDEGDPDPAGYKVWLTDYPEEGSIPLDESPAGLPVKSAERGRVIAALAAKALASPAASPVPADMDNDEPVPTRGTAAITDAWNALPDELRLSPHLSRLFEAVKTCRDVDAPSTTPQPSADMVLVPREPTHAMREAACVYSQDFALVMRGWRAMLAAAPKLATTAQPAAPKAEMVMVSAREIALEHAARAAVDTLDLYHSISEGGQRYEELRAALAMPTAQPSQPAAPTETGEAK